MGKGQQQQLITTKLESVEGLHFNSAIQMCNVDFFTHFSINNSLFSKILDAKKSLGTAKVFFVFTSKSFYLLKLESFGYKQKKTNLD